jgi:hypothetical protein
MVHLPDTFSVRTLVPLMRGQKPAMITNALRYLERCGVIHAPGGKTHEGATGKRKVAVMVWKKGPATGPLVVARKGGDTHVPPSAALKRLGKPSPHDKAAEIQMCMAAGILLENIAGENEQPVFYVPRAWLDERAPAATEAPEQVQVETPSPAPATNDDKLLALFESMDERLRRIVALMERRTGSLF